MDDERYILVGDKMPHTIWGKCCWSGSIVVYNKIDDYYYINIGIFGLESCYYDNNRVVIILSETLEYNVIVDLLKLKDNSVIEKYANELVIKYTPPDKLYSLIKRLSETKYKEGYNDAQLNMRKALGIVN